MVATAAMLLSSSFVSPALATPPLGHDISCNYFGDLVDVYGVKVYRSVVCQYIYQQDADGELLKTEASGWFNTVGYSIQTVNKDELCRYWVDFDIWDSQGTRYFHNQGNQVNSCTKRLVQVNGSRELDADYNIRPESEACATVFQRRQGDIKQVVRTCSYIS